MATNLLVSNQAVFSRPSGLKKTFTNGVQSCPSSGMVPKGHVDAPALLAHDGRLRLSQASSSTYANARSNRAPRCKLNFSLRPNPGSAVIDGRCCSSRQHDVAFVLDTVKRESTNLLMQAQKTSPRTSRERGGAIAQVSSVNSNTITLTYGRSRTSPWA